MQMPSAPISLPQRPNPPPSKELNAQTLDPSHRQLSHQLLRSNTSLKMKPILISLLAVPLATAQSILADGIADGLIPAGILVGEIIKLKGCIPDCLRRFSNIFPQLLLLH